MTEEQINQKLSQIRKLAESLLESGYTERHSAVPTGACWDIRFLLSCIDSIGAQRGFACDDHEWPYGADIEGDNRPRCVWCEALRADALERLVVEASTLLVNATPNTKLIPLESQQQEWAQRFGEWWAGLNHQTKPHSKNQQK